jgi:hypothetical protein
MSAPQILAAYRLMFSALIVVASVQTLLEAPAHHLMLLAVAEIAGAALLLWRQAQWLGASLLLVVFAGAQLMAAAEGDYPTRFVQFAASTLLIVLLDRALRRRPLLGSPPARHGSGRLLGK